MEKNILGDKLIPCCNDNSTGFMRDGYCHVTEQDFGNHSVCAVMTPEFLAFTKAKGNDLSTPRPQFLFPGLNPGDKWCLCAARWEEARLAGVAPKVVLAATSEKCLELIDLEDLLQHAHAPH